MPPRKEFRIPKSDLIVTYDNNTNNDSSTLHQQKSSTKSKGRQDKSLDEKKVNCFYQLYI